MTRRIRVQRPEDLLDLRLEWINVSFFWKGEKAKIQIDNAQLPAYLIVHFPPQHLLEQSIPGQSGPTILPVEIVPSGLTRLVFVVPYEYAVNPQPYTFDEAMKWERFNMNVNGCALPPGTDIVPGDAVPPPGTLTDLETCIEIPWGLKLSPHSTEKWKHCAEPRRGKLMLDKPQRTELWHTSLTSGSNSEATVRAVDLVSGRPPSQAEPLPNASDRQALVHQTANFHLNFKPKAITSDHLMLSGFGAYAKLHVGWTLEEVRTFGVAPWLHRNANDPANASLNVYRWIQETIWGRDQYEHVERLGYLMPFGHPAVLVQIKQREWQPARDANGNGDTDAAILVDHFYCQVLVPTLDYLPFSDGPKLISRRNCFQKITLEPETTPYLLNPTQGQGTSMTGDNINHTWMYLEGDGHPLFKFKVTAIDWQNQTHHFEIPLLWVVKDLAQGTQGFELGFKNAVTEYASRLDRRTSTLSGQKIAFVPPAGSSASKRDTSVRTESLCFAIEERKGLEASHSWLPAGDPGTFTSSPFNAQPDWWPAFYPAVARADVSLDVAASFSTSNRADATHFTWNNEYVTIGLPQSESGQAPNRMEFFADVFGAGLDFAGDKSGGLCTPSINISYLSRKFGPWGPRNVVAHAPAAGGAPAGGGVSADFDPKAFFRGLESAAKLIGGVKLTEVIQEVENAADEITRVPRLIAQQVQTWQATFKDIEAPVRRIMKLLDVLSDTSPQAIIQNIRALVKAKFEEIKANLQARLTQQLQEWLLNEASDAEAVLISLRNHAEAKLTELLNGMDPDDLAAARALLQLATEDPELQQAYRMLWPDRQRLQAAFTLFKARLTGNLKEVVEREAHKRLSDLTARVDPLVHQYANDLAAIKRQLQSEIARRFKIELPALDSQLVQDIAAAVDQAHDQPEQLKARLETIVRGRIEQAIRNRAGALTLAIAGEIDAESFTKQMNQSLARLRDWSEAQVKQLLPAGTKQEIDAAEEALRNFRAAFDFGALVGLVNDVYGGVMAKAEELSGFPLPKIQQLRSAIQRIVDDLTDPSKLVGDLTEALDTLRREIREVAVPGNPAAGGSATVAVNDFEQREEAQLDKLKSRVDESIQRLQVKIQEPLKKLRDDIESQIKALRLPDNNPIAIILRSYTDPTVGAIALRINEQIVQQKDQIVAPIISTIDQVKGQLNAIVGAIADVMNNAAAMVDDIERQVSSLLAKLPKELNFAYSWQPRLQDAGVFVAHTETGPASFTLNAKIHKSLIPKDLASPPSVKVEGTMERFKLHLIPSAPFLTVVFDRVSFVSIDGNKPDVTVKIARVEFDAALAFVKKLAEALSPNSGFFIELAGFGVEVGYRFALPSIVSGGFNLMQIAVVTSVNLPFNGDPVRVRFGLSERHHPFLLSVGVLGGGGFFAITLSAHGVELLEGSMEFGAVIALDIGVASGRVSVTAGIYFSAGRDFASLFGFVRASGSLNVLGLITLTVEFYLGLGYERHGSKSYAVGEAIVHVEIDMTFFSIGVDLHYRKEFEGSGDSAGGGSPLMVTTGSNKQLDFGEPIDELACQRFSRLANEWESYRRYFATN